MGPKRKIISLLLIVISSSTWQFSSAYAKEEKEDTLPLGCQHTGYYFDLKTLTLLPESAGQKQSMYFFYNKLAQPLNVFQMRNEKNPASIYLNHTVPVGRWAVLSTTEKILKFICTTPEKGSNYGKIVDCEEGLIVCEYPNVRYGLNNRGNYWLVQGNTRGGAIQEVIHYGIIPAI